MDAALQRRIQRYGWDKAAEYYENFWQKQLKPAQDLLLTLAMLKDSEKVIDIACGTGLISFRAAAAVGDTGSVLGTDISDKMISSSIETARKENWGNVRFVRMDAEELNVPDNSYEVALCSLGLMYFPDPLKAMKEMHRVLKPGGRGIASVWGQRINCGWAEIFPIVDKRVASEVCPMFFQLGNKQVLQMTFESAGFSDLQSERLPTLLHYNTTAEACGAAFEGGPVALAYAKFNDAVKQEARAEYVASIKKYQMGESFEVPGEFVVTRGYK